MNTIELIQVLNYRKIRNSLRRVDSYVDFVSSDMKDISLLYSGIEKNL